MTPDFEYFLRMKIQSLYSHSLDGLLWFDLPLGLVIAFVFHLWVRDTLFVHLPKGIQCRLTVYIGFDWANYFKRKWLVVCTSLLIGAASHILWDGFTHQHGYFVTSIPQLTQSISLLGKDLLLFKILQHGSTLIGAIVILYAFLQLPLHPNATKGNNSTYWGIVSVVAVLIITLRLAFGLPFGQYGHLIATGIAGLMMGLVVASFITRKIHNSNY